MNPTEALSPTTPPDEVQPPQDWLRAVNTTTASLPGPDVGQGERAQRAEELAEEYRRRAEAAELRVAAIERALASRPYLEQAKGILMGVFGLGADAAFDALVWVSQHSNVRVATVAEQFLVMAKELDCGAPHREEVTHLLAVLANNGYTPTASAAGTPVAAATLTEPG